MSGKKGASQPMYYYVPVAQTGQAAAPPATPTYPAMPSWPWPATPVGGVQYYYVPSTVAGASAQTAPSPATAPRSNMSFVDMTQRAKPKSSGKAVTVDLVSSSSDEDETPKKAKKTSSAPSTAKPTWTKPAPPKPATTTKPLPGILTRKRDSQPPLPPLKTSAKPLTAGKTQSAKASTQETTVPSELLKNVYLGVMATRPISHIKVGPDSLMFYLVLPPNDHVLTLIISATAITKCRVHTEGAPYFVEVHAQDVNYFASQSVTMRSLCGTNYDPRSTSEPHRSLLMEFANEVHPAMLSFLKGGTVKNVEFITDQKGARRLLNSHVATTSLIDIVNSTKVLPTTATTASKTTSTTATQPATKAPETKPPASAPAKASAPLSKIPNFQPPRAAPLITNETPKPTPAPATSNPATPSTVTKPQSTPITKPAPTKPIPAPPNKATSTPPTTATTKTAPAKPIGKSPIGSPGGRKVAPIEKVLPTKSPLMNKTRTAETDSLPLDFGGGHSSEDDLIMLPALTSSKAQPSSKTSTTATKTTAKTTAPLPPPSSAKEAKTPAPAKNVKTNSTPAQKPTPAPIIMPSAVGPALWKQQGMVVIDSDKRSMRKARIVVEESGDSSSGSDWDNDEDGWTGTRKRKEAQGKVEVVVVDGDEGEKKEDEKKEGEKKEGGAGEGEKMDVDAVGQEKKEDEKKEGEKGEERKEGETEKMDVDVAEKKEDEKKEDEKKKGADAGKSDEGDKMDVDVSEKKEDKKEGHVNVAETTTAEKEEEKKEEEKKEEEKKEEEKGEPKKASDVETTVNGEAIIEEPQKESTEVAPTVPVGEVLHLTDDESTTEAQVPTADTAHTQEECILSYPPDGVDSVTLFPSDLERLEEGEYLNDSIVEFYLKYLWRERTSGEQREKLHMFSTFFYNQLIGHSGSSARGAAARERVQRWVKNVDIFSKEALFIPICKDSHWLLAVILHPAHLPEPQPNPLPRTKTFSKRATQQTRCRIIIYDSMVEEDSEQPGVFRRLRRFLTQEWKRKRPTEPPREYTRHNVQCIFANVPTQDNDVDCGLFLLQYVEELLLDPVSNLDNFERPTWFSVANVINTKRAQVRSLIHSLAARYNPSIGPVRPLTGPPAKANASPPPSPRPRAISAGKFPISKTPAAGARGTPQSTPLPVPKRPFPNGPAPSFTSRSVPAPAPTPTPVPVHPLSKNAPAQVVTQSPVVVKQHIPATAKPQTTTANTVSPAMASFYQEENETRRWRGRPRKDANVYSPAVRARSPDITTAGGQKRAYSTRSSEKEKAMEKGGEKRAKVDGGEKLQAPKTPPTSSLPPPSTMQAPQRGGLPGANSMPIYPYPGYKQYYSNPYGGINHQLWYPPQQHWAGYHNMQQKR